MKSPGHVISALIQEFFRRTGILVYRHKHFFFWIPVLLTAFSSIGLLRFYEENRIWYLYSPTGAPSHYEHAVANEFFNDRGGKFWLEVTITAKDMDNLLRREYLDGVDGIAEFLQYNFSVPCAGVRGNQSLCSFNELCSGACNDNQVIPLFNLIYRNESSRLHPNFRLTFPTMHLYNDEYYVGEHFAGVEIDKATNVISKVKVIVLYFRTDRQNPQISAVINDWEQKMFAFSENFEHPILNMTINSDAMIAREVRVNGLSCVPYFGFSIAFVFMFIIITNRREHFVLSHSVVMSVLGVAGPLMAIGTAFGLLFLVGVPFNSITFVMPFLIIGVGSDDVFIIIHAMRKTDKKKSLEEQVAETMEEAGPSITVTSVTNILSFGIGIATSTPAISIFCLYTCTAITIDFVYQLTFFVAALVYEEERVRKLHQNEKPPIAGINDQEVKKSAITVQHSLRSSHFPLNPNGFVAKYCQFLKLKKTRFVLLLILSGYWAASTYGCLNMDVKMDTTNLILKDSPLNHIAYIYEKYLWSEGQLVLVFLNNLPDLSVEKNQFAVLDLVHRFETLPYSMGRNSTSIWLRPFLYQSALYHGKRDFYDLLGEWLDDSENGGSRWNDMLRVQKTTNGSITGIEKFMFATGCAMGEDANWGTREKLQKQWRSVAAEYPQFNTTVFQAYSFYVDQLDTIAGTALSTVIVSALTMDLACFLLIPHASSIISSMIAMISINIGVFGLLSLWDVNLDPITMCTTLMSIGFSVDFTAHISFHYYKNPETWSAEERLADALKSIGWPMIQAGTSTFFCMLPLAINDSYMVGVFVKTICLVIALGLLHGIIFLPALLLTIGGGGKINPDLALEPSQTQISIITSSSGSEGSFEKVKAIDRSAG